MKKRNTNYNKIIFHSVIAIIVIVVIGVIIIKNIPKISERNINMVETPAEKLSQSSYPDFSALYNEDSMILTDNNGQKYILEESKIKSGGPPKGSIGGFVGRGIPALSDENIKYISVQDADWIEDNELVLALQYKGIERVYPLQILVWHEIANDVVSGDPLLITYCPLCGSGIAYYRVLDGDPVEFGTSGKLYNSNLIMYDDKTNTYWQQIDGNAIKGELTGFELQEISIDTVVWRDWKKSHPNSQVLSKNTGFSRSYGTDPYGSYYEDSFLLFPPDEQDDRIHPKTVIHGIEIKGDYKAYQEDDIIMAGGKIYDRFNGVDIIITRSEDGIVKIVRSDNGEEIIKERDFWFAWYAFHPDTDIYSL
jgi:hypothetical protein